MQFSHLMTSSGLTGYIADFLKSFFLKSHFTAYRDIKCYIIITRRQWVNDRSFVRSQTQRKTVDSKHRQSEGPELSWQDIRDFRWLFSEWLFVHGWKGVVLDDTSIRLKGKWVFNLCSDLGLSLGFHSQDVDLLLALTTFQLQYLTTPEKNPTTSVTLWHIFNAYYYHNKAPMVSRQLSKSAFSTFQNLFGFIGQKSAGDIRVHLKSQTLLTMKTCSVTGQHPDKIQHPRK